ncbi:hypothetical protein BDN71DRAFT_1452844 [Pleurotus eryngii]|uniref:Uncharacterized protein n=1 Tax=Pleurotus eryngii TaxID=5323 RepID=A0A9P5ZPC3_PLEER|nr:hypothetical protein BDN71DRAFT_1452844 [Pleurotus eryngii]
MQAMTRISTPTSGQANGTKQPPRATTDAPSTVYIYNTHPASMHHHTSPSTTEWKRLCISSPLTDANSYPL